MLPPRSAHFRLWLRFGLVVALASGGVTVSAADPPLHPKLHPILVRGKVTAFELAKGNLTSPATVEIVHVYSGNPELVGKTLTDYYQPFGNGHSAPLFTAMRPLKVGEVGVWTLTESGVGKQLAVVARQAPSQTITKEPASMKLPFEWADTVEKYTKATPKVRMDMASKLVRSPNGQIMNWMIRTLGEEDSKEAEQLLKKLQADVEVDLWVQIQLDEIFCRKDKELWYAAPARLAMLKTWVSGKPKGFYAPWVLDRLDGATQLDQLRLDKAFELHKLAVENKDWPEKYRLEAIWRVGLIAGRAVDDEVADAWLFDVMRTHAVVAYRRAAARAIYCLPLYSTRLKAVEEHLRTESDTEIKATLTEAVKKAKEDKKK